MLTENPLTNHIDKIAGTRMKSYGFSGHIVVEKGRCSLWGQPNGSTDSRVLGCIDKRNILGKVVFRVYPMSGFGKVE